MCDSVFQFKLEQWKSRNGILVNVKSLMQSAFPAAASVPDALFCSAAQFGQAVEQWRARVASQGQEIVALSTDMLDTFVNPDVRK